jgi:hypothetical protein
MRCAGTHVIRIERRARRGAFSMISCDQHLAALDAAMRPLEAEIRQLSVGLTDEQLHWAAEPGRWSIAQCL